MKERKKSKVRARKSEENAEREGLSSGDYSNRITAQREWRVISAPTTSTWQLKQKHKSANTKQKPFDLNRTELFIQSRVFFLFIAKLLTLWSLIGMTITQSANDGFFRAQMATLKTSQTVTSWSPSPQTTHLLC